MSEETSGYGKTLLLIEDDYFQKTQKENEKLFLKLGFRESFEKGERVENSFHNEDFDVVLRKGEIGIIPYPHDPNIDEKTASGRYNGFAMFKGAFYWEHHGEEFLKDILEVCLKHKKIKFNEP